MRNKIEQQIKQRKAEIMAEIEARKTKRNAELNRLRIQQQLEDDLRKEIEEDERTGGCKGCRGL